MAEEKEEPIDLNKLSQRELLIVVATEVKGLKENVNSLQAGQQEMKLKVNTIETRGKVWGGIMGIFGAGAVAVLERIFNR